VQGFLAVGALQTAFALKQDTRDNRRVAFSVDEQIASDKRKRGMESTKPPLQRRGIMRAVAALPAAGLALLPSAH
jgi:hypothetical protein